MVDQTNYNENEKFLPIANISRIMKKALPVSAKVSKEAKQVVQECVSEFISFVTSEASERCMGDHRKTLNCDDLLWALTTLGFEPYIDVLGKYLMKYRQATKHASPNEKQPKDKVYTQQEFNEDDFIRKLSI